MEMSSGGYKKSFKIILFVKIYRQVKDGNKGFIRELMEGGKFQLCLENFLSTYTSIVKFILINSRNS